MVDAAFFMLHTEDESTQELMKNLRTLINPEVILCIPSDTVLDAAQRMSAGRGEVVMVQQGQDVVGIFTTNDLLHRVVARKLNPALTPLAQVMTSPVKTLDINTPAADAFDLLLKARYRHLPVTENGDVVGVICTYSHRYISAYLKFGYESGRHVTMDEVDKLLSGITPRD